VEVWWILYVRTANL